MDIEEILESQVNYTKSTANFTIILVLLFLFQAGILLVNKIIDIKKDFVLSLIYFVFLGIFFGIIIFLMRVILWDKPLKDYWNTLKERHGDSFQKRKRIGIVLILMLFDILILIAIISY